MFRVILFNHGRLQRHPQIIGKASPAPSLFTSPLPPFWRPAIASRQQSEVQQHRDVCLEESKKASPGVAGPVTWDQSPHLSCLQRSGCRHPHSLLVIVTKCFALGLLSERVLGLWVLSSLFNKAVRGYLVHVFRGFNNEMKWLGGLKHSFLLCSTLANRFRRLFKSSGFQCFHFDFHPLNLGLGDDSPLQDQNLSYKTMQQEKALG